MPTKEPLTGIEPATFASHDCWNRKATHYHCATVASRELSSYQISSSTAETYQNSSHMYHYIRLGISPQPSDALTIRKNISDALSQTFGLSSEGTYVDILSTPNNGKECVIRVQQKYVYIWLNCHGFFWAIMLLVAMPRGY